MSPELVGQKEVTPDFIASDIAECDQRHRTKQD